MNIPIYSRVTYKVTNNAQNTSITDNNIIIVYKIVFSLHIKNIPLFFFLCLFIVLVIIHLLPKKQFIFFKYRIEQGVLLANKSQALTKTYVLYLLRNIFLCCSYRIIAHVKKDCIYCFLLIDQV